MPNKFIRIDGKRNPYRRERIEAGNQQGYDVYGVDTFETVTTDFKPFKKTSVTYATQIPVRFFVDTIEGAEQEGQPGDFLAVGAAGEMYPIAHDIFLNTYEIAEDA